MTATGTSGVAGSGHGVRGPGARRSPGARAVLLVTALLLAVAPGASPAGKGATPPDPLASLKTGHWIRIEGAVQPDSTALCEELRVLTGDFLDDDWSVRGLVQAIDKSKHEIVIGGIHIQVTENTGFDSPRDTFRSFSDLRTGWLLEVEGTYLKSRKFVAREVDDESDEVGRKPWPGNRLRIVAKAERVDTRRRLVTAMGFVFQLTDRTRLRTVIE